MHPLVRLADTGVLSNRPTPMNRLPMHPGVPVTYFAVLRAGLWHVQREFTLMPIPGTRNCFCAVDDNDPETEEKYLDEQIITCIECQVGLATIG
jgi:hypothetical protein